MNILVDIGNSRLKWGIGEYDDVIFCGAIDYHRENDMASLIEAWKNLSRPTRLAISSVAEKHRAEQLIQVAQLFWPDVDLVIPVSSSFACQVTNAYRQAEKLGIDRWLNLLALRHYYPGPACVVDCGTAITVDFLDELGQHLGGLISPGLMLMKKSLLQGTADLPFSEVVPCPGLADDTEAGIYCGTLYAAAGLIELALSRQPDQQNVILTGGDAGVIARNLAVRTVVEPDFVLKGLALYCDDKLSNQ